MNSIAKNESKSVIPNNNEILIASTAIEEIKKEIFDIINKNWHEYNKSDLANNTRLIVSEDIEEIEKALSDIVVDKGGYTSSGWVKKSVRIKFIKSMPASIFVELRKAIREEALMIKLVPYGNGMCANMKFNEKKR